ARRRRRDNGVGDVAVVQVVVDAGYGNGLRCIPVAGREREARQTDRALRRVARAQPDGHVGGRLRVEPHGERGRAAGLGRGQTGGRVDDNGDSVVVDVGDGDVDRIDPVIFA